MISIYIYIYILKECIYGSRYLSNGITNYSMKGGHIYIVLVAFCGRVGLGIRNIVRPFPSISLNTEPNGIKRVSV